MVSGAHESSLDDGKPSATQLLNLDIDIRIGVETWAELWSASKDQGGLLTGLLRVVYGKGYTDALTEPRRGQLCRDHGLKVSTRRRT